MITFHKCAKLHLKGHIYARSAGISASPVRGCSGRFSALDLLGPQVVTGTPLRGFPCVNTGMGDRQGVRLKVKALSLRLVQLTLLYPGAGILLLAPFEPHKPNPNERRKGTAGNNAAFDRFANKGRGILESAARQARLCLTRQRVSVKNPTLIAFKRLRVKRTGWDLMKRPQRRTDETRPALFLA
jgi:hypothetical protein